MSNEEFARKMIDEGKWEELAELLKHSLTNPKNPEYFKRLGKRRFLVMRVANLLNFRTRPATV